MLSVFRLKGRWTVEVDPETNHFDLYFTKPDGERGLYNITWGDRRDPSLPEYQPLIHEVAKPDGTIGVVCPFVAKYKDGLYIVVERVERHIGQRVEVARKSWDNPSDLPQIPDTAKVERYDLGRGDSNTARIVGGDGIVHKIVILSQLEELPVLAGKPFWMKLETYADHRDQMGLAVIAKAMIKGYLK